MDLRDRAKALRAQVEGSMGRFVTVNQRINNRAAAGLADQGPVANNGQQQGPLQPPFPLVTPSRHIQPHGFARQARMARHQAPMVHRLAAPVLAAGARPATPGPPEAGQATPVPRVANPYSFVAAHLRQPDVPAPGPIPGPGAFQPQQQQQQQLYQYGGGYGQGFAPGFEYQAQFASPSGGEGWQSQEGAHQPTRYPAMPLPAQPQEGEAACSWAANCWPELPADRLPGAFSMREGHKYCRRSATGGDTGGRHKQA
jgi:hypothetical protein